MLEDFSTALLAAMFVVFVGAPLLWLVLREMASSFSRRHAIRRRLDEPSTHGDDGGRPVYGVERRDCDQPGRVEILPRRAGK